MKIKIALHFEKYLSAPYWPARAKVIDVEKQSGVNRVRSDAARERALGDWLAAHGMTREELDGLKALAERPFYTQEGTGEILIPSLHFVACMVRAAHQCSSSVRIARPEQLRSILFATALATGKTEADGVWERFVVVKSGTGQSLSCQRALRSDPYLADFDATGQLTFLGDKAALPKLQEFIRYAGREVGCGASRSMGWGRFTLAEFEAVA